MHAGSTLQSMTKTNFPVLGVDIGRVIIGASDPSGRADTSFLSGSDDDALATPPCAGALPAVAALVTAFEGRVWLVSKCGPRIQALTLRWLKRQHFHEATGLRRDRVRFCLERAQKRQHCAAIGATHFIDDRLDVLTHLRGQVPHLYWFGHQRTGTPTPDWAQPTPTWEVAQRAVLADLRGRAG